MTVKLTAAQKKAVENAREIISGKSLDENPAVRAEGILNPWQPAPRIVVTWKSEISDYRPMRRDSYEVYIVDGEIWLEHIYGGGRTQHYGRHAPTIDERAWDVSKARSDKTEALAKALQAYADEIGRGTPPSSSLVELANKRRAHARLSRLQGSLNTTISAAEVASEDVSVLQLLSHVDERVEAKLDACKAEVQRLEERIKSND